MAKPVSPKIPTKIPASELSGEALAEIETLSAGLSITFERTECGDVVSYLNKLYQLEKQGKSRRIVLKKIKNLIKNAEGGGGLYYSRARHAPRRGESITATVIGTGSAFSRSGLVDKPFIPMATTHEGKQAWATIRRILGESVGFWRSIEKHFKDKPMTELIESVIGENREEELRKHLIARFFKIPTDASEHDIRRSLELELMSRFLGRDFGNKPPSTLASIYDFMRSSRDWRQQVQAYALLKKLVNAKDVEMRFLEGVKLDQLFEETQSPHAVERSCLLLSLATDYDAWHAAIKKLLRIDRDTASLVLEDLADYARGRKSIFLGNIKIRGGEGTVLRMEFSIDGAESVLFFRFGDARSHALGYELLRRFGFPVPESMELKDSLCSIEKNVEGKNYQDAHEISRETAKSFGRLIAACFVLGIPDPNPTNFIIRGKGDVVKIDAESAPIGWNYYSGIFIGGVAEQRPNDSLSFTNLTRIHSDAVASIRAGFTEGIELLKKQLSKKGAIDAVCRYVEDTYMGAHLYRSAGDGITPEIISRLRKRLMAVIERDPEELLGRAERGIDV